MTISRTLGVILFVSLGFHGGITAAEKASQYGNCSSSQSMGDCCRLKTGLLLLCKTECPAGWYNITEKDAYSTNDTYEVFKEIKNLIDAGATYGFLFTNGDSDLSQKSFCEECDVSCGFCTGPGVENCLMPMVGFSGTDAPLPPGSKPKGNESSVDAGRFLSRGVVIGIIVVVCVFIFLLGYAVQKLARIYDNHRLKFTTAQCAAQLESTEAGTAWPIFSPRWHIHQHFDHTGGKCSEKCRTWF